MATGEYVTFTEKGWYPGEWAAGVRGVGDEKTGKGLRGPEKCSATFFGLVTKSSSRRGRKIAPA